jgi:predicted nucleotidyltransferase
MKPTVTLCKLLGGSHLYGLNTPESDIDYRGVFMHTDPSYILGTKRFDEERHQDPSIQEDLIFKELNHFAGLLKAANSEALEYLFAPTEVFTEFSESWARFRGATYSLVDTHKLYKCLRGYMQGEYRLAIGERKGTIGGKRYAEVIKYGFSRKNFTQLFRLAYVGQTFFLEDRFVVNIKKDAPTEIYDKLMKVKTQPWEFTKEVLTQMYLDEEKKLEDAFNNRIKTYTFSEDLINNLLLEAYKPYLQ